MSSSGDALPTKDPRASAPAPSPLEEDGRRAGPTATADSPATAAKRPTGRRRTIAIAVLAVVAIVVGAYVLNGRRFEETDDAQVDGNISGVGPRVVGNVRAVYVSENQPVKLGDLLLELDPTDLEVAVAQSRAAVAQAEAQLQAEDPTVAITETSNTAAVASASSELASASAGVTAAERDVEQLTARLTEAEGNARLAATERQRGDELWKGQAIPRAEYDRRVNAAETAAADARAIKQALEAARQKVRQQEAALVATKSRLSEVRQNAPKQMLTRRASVLSRQANLDLARAQLKQSELNLSYARLVSPVAGVVAKKAVAVGDHVAPGQQLFAVAQIGDLWVTANFRETQLERMQPGQPVEVHVDALDVDLRGHVESLGATTGSRLSLLPPENAAGNYVKVVQRIPVRIRFEPGQAGTDRLRPGMSVEPKVKVTR
jgi:membrane fusion protein (multidrug efflux system)